MSTDDIFEPRTKLIVGLGNPGVEYKNTRHNIGFEILQDFGASTSIELKKENKFKAWLGLNNSLKLEYTTISKDEEGKKKLSHLCQVKLICAMPTTYMNLSGLAINKIRAFYKIKLKDILIIHDDVSLDTGSYKLSFNRGAGGQHGIEDSIEKLGSKAFYRLRIGVGPDPGGDARADFVLSKFRAEEKTQLEEISTELKESVLKWLCDIEDIQKIRSVQIV